MNLLDNNSHSIIIRNTIFQQMFNNYNNNLCVFKILYNNNKRKKVIYLQILNV